MPQPELLGSGFSLGWNGIWDWVWGAENCTNGNLGLFWLSGRVSWVMDSDMPWIISEPADDVAEKWGSTDANMTRGKGGALSNSITASGPF